MATTSVNNGVNVQALLDAREVLKGAPEAAKFTWRASCKWQNGTHSESKVQSFFGLGQEQNHKKETSLGADVSTFNFSVLRLEAFAGASLSSGVAAAAGSGVAAGTTSGADSATRPSTAVDSFAAGLLTSGEESSRGRGACAESSTSVAFFAVLRVARGFVAPAAVVLRVFSAAVVRALGVARRFVAGLEDAPFCSSSRGCSTDSLMVNRERGVHAPHWRSARKEKGTERTGKLADEPRRDSAQGSEISMRSWHVVAFPNVSAVDHRLRQPAMAGLRAALR